MDASIVIAAILFVAALIINEYTNPNRKKKKP